MYSYGVSPFCVRPHFCHTEPEQVEPLISGGSSPPAVKPLLTTDEGAVTTGTPWPLHLSAPFRTVSETAATLQPVSVPVPEGKTEITFPKDDWRGILLVEYQEPHRTGVESDGGVLCPGLARRVFFPGFPVASWHRNWRQGAMSTYRGLLASMCTMLFRA